MSLALNALFKKYSTAMADLDLEKSKTNTAYGDAQANWAEDRKRDLDILAQSEASRGLTHSGLALKDNVNLQKGYTRSKDKMEQGYNTTLTNISKKRLAAQNEYDEGRATLDIQKLLGG